jgi:hypothetical protein
MERLLMAELIKNLEVIRTDTKTYKVTITDDGAVVNITGHTLFFTVKAKITDADSAALISKTVVCPNNSDSIAGIGFITLSSTDTAILAGNYTYDLKYQKDTNLRKTVMSGIYQVNNTVTQRTS